MIAINTEKKLVIRKAPTEKASTYENGFIATGSDNENYIVTEVKNGFKRWMKAKDNVEPVVIVEEKPEKPKRTYKKKVVEQEPEPIVEQEPEPVVKPKRTYKKKVVEPEPVKEPEPEPEPEVVKPKRPYKKTKN